MSHPFWNLAPQPPLFTGIGSLPHHNLDAALTYAFSMKIPFLPQIPRKNPREFMVSQALEGLPGLVGIEKGEAILDEDRWLRDSGKLANQLEAAFRAPGNDLKPFESFEPTPESYSAWRPFLWELGERKLSLAKVQLCGPMTSQWALRLKDGTPADKVPEIGMQIFRLVLARSVAMVRRLRSYGVTPLFYLDEPGFYCFSKTEPRHVLGLQELKLFIQTLKKEEALVGIHCCSNTDWPSVLSLNLDVLSIDSQLSLVPLLKSSEALGQFLKEGGRLSLGVVPTAKGGAELQSFEPEMAFEQLLTDLHEHGINGSTLTKVLSETIYTPACGLALHEIENAEIILSYTAEIASLSHRYVHSA